MRIDSGMVCRSALGAGLKSIGGLIYRVNDIPESQKALRRQVFLREALVVGAIFAASLLLEGAFARVMPRLQKHLSEAGVQLVQFLPQAAAYALAESGSRMVFPVKDSFEKALDDPPGEIKPNPFASESARWRVASPTLPAADEVPFNAALFRAQSQYTTFHEPNRQPITMRGFY